jgi:hypothetical protein
MSSRARARTSPHTSPHEAAPASRSHSHASHGAATATALSAPPPSVDAFAASGGLRVKAYRGDSSVLLAFDVDQNRLAGLAGFAVKCTSPDGNSFVLKNRLSFDNQIQSSMTTAQRHALLTPTDQAPYQKFRWIDFSSSAGPGRYVYEVTSMYFNGGALKAGATVQVPLDLGPYQSGNLQVGFTRGFLSSQAYAC